MIDINEVQIGNISGSEIVHFEFSEGQLCGLMKGTVALNRIMTQDEMNVIKSVSISNYPGSRLYHAKIDEAHNKTFLYFSELHNISNYVPATTTTYTAISFGTVSYNMIKLGIGTTTITMDSTATLNFTGTTSIAGYGSDVVQFGLSLYKFAYLRLNSTTNVYHVHLPSDPYFSLGNDINNSVTLSVTPATVPDTYLTKDNFEVGTITVYCPFNEKIVLNTKGFVANSILSVTDHNPLNLLLPYVISDTGATILPTLKPFLVGNYVGVKGRIIKDGVQVNVGDTVVYGEYQGIVNKVVRTIEYDEICFGYPPFPKTIASNRIETKTEWFFGEI